ncbi:MAG: hypothetical protein HKL90_16225 [Elusimicrobia bacterium]|nr:hypothetical protein [Elusimicrobiota bacterium]
MATRIGVWIDHRTAVVSDADEAGGATRRITTDLGKQLRLSGGRRARTQYGPQISPPDDMREADSRGRRRVFFDEVAAVVRGALRLFVFGPGEAKAEFKKRLKSRGFPGLIDEPETAERMSDRQVAAKTRAHFGAARGYRIFRARSRKASRRPSSSVGW